MEGREAGKGKMERKIVKITALAIIMCFSTSSAAVTPLWIDNVDVSPEEPLDIDIITFDVYGGASSSWSWVEYDEFYQNGASLQLDVYVNTGIQPMVSYWTHSREIPPLAADTYTLEVRALFYQSSTIWDTYTVDFTVVPEPASLVLFGSGLLIVRPFSRRKRIRS
jgi:hypothetical protein